ncbi:molecular chaperone TorD family protein [Candidatus Poribacteria bacterium]|nr:molecular chaperone TorD family protein [Candidatus Poribacteria bacterium]
MSREYLDFHGELAEVRKNIYQFLASVFLEKPTQELVETLVADDTIDVLSEIFSEASISHLREFCREYSGDITMLQVEYTALMVAPFGAYVTPYESAYRGGREIDGRKSRGLLMGQPALEVKRTIRKAGGEIDRTSHRLPDHIGLELQAMQFLCEQEARAWAADQPELALKYVRFQEDFVRDHLSVWVPDLAARIMENAASGFFKGIACMTRELIATEMNTFDCASPGSFRGIGIGNTF